MNSFLHILDVLFLRSFATTLLLVFWITNLHSQILYTDINDTILTFPENVHGVLDDSTNYFYFDLDQDGDMDFYFYAHYWEEWYSPSANEHPHYVMELKSVFGDGIPWTSDNGCALDFAHDDTIQSDIWDSFGILRVSVVSFGTNCNLPFMDRHFGLRMIQGSDHHYGWIRLDADIDTLVFKDFAINTVANEPIQAGQTTSAGIEDGNIDEPKIYFDGRSLHFEANTFNQYMIYSIDGKVLEKEYTPANGILDTQHLSPGFYIITLIGPEAIVSRKIIQQN